MSARQWKDGLQQSGRLLPDGFLAGPAIERLGAAIPIGDGIRRIAHEDGVVREVEQRRLFPQGTRGILVAQAQQGRDHDGDDADRAAHGGGESVIIRVHDREAQHREADAAARDKQKSRPFEEARREENHERVEHRDGHIQRRERVDEEDAAA